VRRALALLAACFAGAAGFGLEILLLQCAGLALGHGRSAAWGLSLFVTGWALGAFVAGRLRGRPVFWIAAAGASLALLAPLAVALVLHAATLASQLQADALACAAIGCAAFVQGMFLPLLLRGRDPLGRWIDGAAALVAANLCGGLAGAWWFGANAVLERHTTSARNAGLLALAAGIAGALAIARDERPPRARGPIAWRAGGCIALVTVWTLALEYAGLRLSVLWIGGMQYALTAALAASVGGLALGAALLPPLVPRGERGVLVLLLLALAASVWPACASTALAAIDPAHDPLGLARAGLLLAPALLPLGAFPAVLHRTLAGDGGERLGALYLHEAWGALLGLPLLHEFVVPALGLRGLLACGAALGLLIALLFLRASRPLALCTAAAALATGSALFLRPPPALSSPPLVQPALELRSFREDRDFAVSVVDDGILGERTLLTDGFRAAGTGRDYLYMQVLGHLPLLLHPTPERVAVLALGTGTTVGAVALHPEVRRIEVLEISRAVVEAAPLFAQKNHGCLDEGLPALLDDRPERRLVVRLGDGRRTLAQRPACYDVITMEPLLPDSPFGVYLYTEDFYAIARRALRPGGLVCQWVPPHALEPQTFGALLTAFGRSFPWHSAWLCGTQLILLGGEREPALDPARWRSLTPELGAALAGLGIDSPAGLAARWVRGPLAQDDLPSGLELSDDRPWIVYLPRRSGAVLLGDLPANLAWLRERSEALPESWRAFDGERREGLRALHFARELQSLDEARLRGLPLPRSTSGSSAAEELARAQRLAAGDPELAVFESEREFLEVLRRGVANLVSDAPAALPDLVRAAELRKERADVHLYLAVALERCGDPTSVRALAAALERCPGIARTREGLRARQLGLSDAAWSRLERAAAEDRTQELR
jgi:spermidine synthase